MSSFTTACPRSCYSTCALTVQVEDGRLRRIDTHPQTRATPGGPCLKGLSYVERVHSPDRILHPLRRTRGGAFERVSWDSALDAIAAKLMAIRRDPGPQSVLYYCASGTKGLMNRVSARFWRLYGGYTGTCGDLCWPSGLEATRLTLGDNKHNAPWDLANARLVVLWGKNAAETNIHQQAFIDQALDAGGALIVIDPRRTQSAERASLLIQPRPGTDGALALAVAHLLIEAGGVDRAFVDRHVLGPSLHVVPLKPGRLQPEMTAGEVADPTAVPPPARASAVISSGRSGRAWRAMLNLRRSWLSREVATLSAFFGLATLWLAFAPESRALGWTATAVGFAGLFAADQVYGVLPGGAGLRHSAGVTWIGLLVAALFAHVTLLAGLVLGLQTGLYAVRTQQRAMRGRPVRVWVSAVRAGAGLLAPLALVVAGPPATGAIVTLVLAGAIVGRCEYYMDLERESPRRQMDLALYRMTTEWTTECPRKSPRTEPSAASREP